MSKVPVEYVWLDANGGFRSKCRILETPTGDLSNIPAWNYDGSSTGQAEGHCSEVIIHPRCQFRDPFRRNLDGWLVICDTYQPDGTPLPDNGRARAVEIFNARPDEHPWFGLEQEYFLVDPETDRPLGFPPEGEPEPQGPYYCGVGAGRAIGREIVEEHLSACLYAGIKISGVNGEVAPGQWEYQVGPCEGIESGDHVQMARYLMERVAERHGLRVDLSPKPEKGDWNGSGCHVNFSTLAMRQGASDGRTGLEVIEQAISRLASRHSEHMQVYGEGNEERLTGKHETARYDEFTHGWANRGASVRIGSDTIRDKQGYFEDRRPASNIDPYLVTSKIFETSGGMLPP